MKYDPFSSSPFLKFLPVEWEISGSGDTWYSLTRSHGLKTRVHLHNLSSPFNAERSELDAALITYEVEGRHYDLYSVSDLLNATYSFDEDGFSNMKGDLAERVARRIMKRFLQRFDSHRGRLGGLFNKQFDPKFKENYVVAHKGEYILKIGRYPNMILLRRTGRGDWGYQHVTDLDGLFDYRYLSRRHMIIMESKTGKIDINAEALHETLFVPLRKLFPEATFTYVLIGNKKMLFDDRNPEYRTLQEAPIRIFNALAKNNVPCFFFEFSETDEDFNAMCRHLITSYGTYHHEMVSFQGKVSISDSQIVIFNPGSKTPYIQMERDPLTGQFQVSHAPRFSSQVFSGAAEQDMKKPDE